MRELTALAQSAPEIAGTWQGTLQIGEGQRVLVKIFKAGTGAGAGWQGELYNIDSGDASMIPSITLAGGDVKFTIPSTEAGFKGKLSADGASMAGMFTQESGSYALNLVRATADTAWAIPEPDKYMARDADPAFEVATIKQSKPDDHAVGHDARGRHVTVENTP